METKFVRGSSNPESGKDVNCLPEYIATEKLNQKQELDEPVNVNGYVEKKVREFYFIKHWPYEDQTLKSRIEEAEKLIEKIHQEESPVNQKYEEICNRSYTLKHLRDCERGIRMDLDWKTRKMDDLQEALDKLSFPKNSNRIAANKMVHRPNNLAAEKKLLREINESQKKTAVNSYSSVEEFSEFILWFYGKIEWRQNDKILEDKIFKKIKWLEKVGKGDTADATEKGKIGNPLNTRKSIQELVRLINKISEEFSKEHLEVMAKIRCVEKDSKLDEDIYRLEKQRNDFWQRRDAVERNIKYLRKQQDEAKARYDKYVSVLSNARELARKKDVEALQELSLREVDIFMSSWNRSKDFRCKYVIMRKASSNHLTTAD